ncbi:MAG: VPLPA-CTERM-specific exosortase XrtD, partial [Bdellovibrionales bacterium]
MPFAQKIQKFLPSSPATVFSLLIFVWLAFLYAKPLGDIWYAWGSEEYSHGYLIPLISVLWGLRLLQKSPVETKLSLGGISILAIGIVFLFLGRLVANNWLSQISIVVSLTGYLGAFWGWAFLKRIAAPLFFLLFAVPLPATVLPSLTAGMQLVSSDLGVGGLQLLGYSVYQEGNVIDLGVIKLQVAEACSGLRYLFPLMSLGFLVAFHVYETKWKRAVLFLSTIPIAILVNGIRIALTGMVANSFGVKVIEGDIHEFEGFVVFIFCLAALMLVKTLLDRFGSKEEGNAIENILPSFDAPLGVRTPYLTKQIVIASFLIVLVSTFGASVFADSSRQPVLGRQSFANFPMRLDDWYGRTEPLSTDELISLKLTDYLLTVFSQEKEGLPVTFYIAYYESQRQGSSIHSPQICLPGSGWKIASREVKHIDLNVPALKPFSVNREIIRKGEQRQLVYYWFRESGVDVATNLEAKLQMIRSGFSSNRTDGSLIRLTTPILGDQDEQKAEAQLEAFMKVSLPLLPAYLP